MYKAALYCCLYAGGITLITLMSAGAPSVRQMENVFFDAFQRALTIDNHRSGRYEKFRDELDHLFLINIDTSFFDFERERINKRALAKLLDTLREKATPRSVFVDCFCEPTSTDPAGDSILLESMAKWGGRLVFPLRSPPRIQDIGEYVPFGVNIPEYHHGFKTGYVDYRRNYYDGKNTCRSVQVGFWREKLPSATYALLQSVDKEVYARKAKNTPSVFELNYIFRNHSTTTRSEEQYGQFPLVDWRDAVKVLEGVSLPAADDVVFIGSFVPITNQYRQKIDVFPTPVGGKQPGIYVIINSYLNVITESYLRPAKGWLVFIANLLLTVIGVVYVEQAKHKKNYPMVRRVLEITGSILLFLSLLFFLFAMFYTKFPFVIASLFFVLNTSIYITYKQVL